MMDMRKPVRGTIASAISEARASLKDPSRPFTPAAMTIILMMKTVRCLKS